MLQKTSKTSAILGAGTNDKGCLRQIYDRTEQLLSWQRQVLAILPEDLSGQVWVGGFKDGRLSLVANSSAWGTRLRMEIPGLAKRLAALPSFQGLTEIRPCVSPFPPDALLREYPLTERSISARTRDILRSLARDTEHPRLRASLERLSRQS